MTDAKGAPGGYLLTFLGFRESGVLMYEGWLRPMLEQGADLWVFGQRPTEPCCVKDIQIPPRWSEAVTFDRSLSKPLSISAFTAPL